MFKKLSFIVCVLSLSACSILPYEENFACQGDRTYGKCTDVEGAYHEAVTGEPLGAPIGKDGAIKQPKKAAAKTKDKLMRKAEAETYQNYRAEMYDQLQALTAAPKTPLVKKAVEVRTLVLSYSPNSQKDRLYMPRYIYSIHKPAEFVLGQYLLENQDESETFNNLLNKKAEQ